MFALLTLRREISPGTALILYYALAIVLGTLALSLPQAVHGESLAFVDALFTATSAQCVTGLIVVDTGSKLTLFGQLVVLVLIQIGGLGITTFSVFLFFYLRRGVSMRGRWILHDTLLHTPVSSLKELVMSVFWLTLIVEGAGTLLLSLQFVPEMGLAEGLYCAFFHAVSAFCNAGFSLFSDSLVAYRGNSLVNLTVMGLIVLGGAGFLVIREVMDLLRRRELRRLSLHSRLVLLTSAVLVVGGTLGILLVENGTAMGRMGWTERLWSALFQSVTARTAGFNTINLNLLGVPSLFLIIFLMFIGASPGSAGGGIKTTSLAIFVAALRSRLKGQRHTNVFRRTIPVETSNKALTLVMLAALFLGAALFALLAVQLHGLSFFESRGMLMDYAFEAVSAFATVGLSLGVTAQLAPAGKLIIIVLMFTGRVGLLTLAFAIARRRKPESVHYGEENVMIG